MKLNETKEAFAGNANRKAAAPAKHATGLHRIAILTVLLSGPCLLAMVFTVLPPVLPGIAEHFGGGSTGQLVAQLIMTLPSIGLMVGGPLAGWLIDRLGARQVLLSALAAYAVFGSAGFYIDHQSALLATRLALGFAASGIVTACATLIGEQFDAVARARLLGYGGFFGAGAGLLSILLSGVIAEAGGWHAPFALFLSALVVLALARGCIPIRPVITHSHEKTTTGEPGALLALLPLYTLIALIFAAAFMTNAQVSFLLVANGIRSPATQSWVIGMASLGSGIGGGVYGWIRSWLGHRRTYCLMLTMLTIGIVILGLSHSPAVAAIGCALAGFGGGLSVPHFLNMVMDRANERIRSRALGLAYSALFLGDFLNPIVMVPVTHLLGIHGAFITVGGVLALGALYIATRR